MGAIIGLQALPHPLSLSLSIPNLMHDTLPLLSKRENKANKQTNNKD